MKNNIKVWMLFLLATLWSGWLWASDGHHGHGGHGEHVMHGAGSSVGGHTGETYRVTPTLPEVIAPGQPWSLVFDITESTGQPVDRFDVVHEELLHLIVVSADLGYYDHIHPEHLGKGRFAVTTSLPAAGSYSFFCDYQPAGKRGQVSLFTVQVPGTPAPVPPPSTASTQVQGDTLVTMQTEPAVVQAGKNTIFRFALAQASDRTPIDDLKPYLGEMGHLVIVRQTAPLTVDEYIHTHAMPSTDTSTVPFAAVLPQSGWYRLFAQFNRNGTILTASFWLQVE